MFSQILALDKTGAPSEWINYEHAAVYYAKNRVLWELGGDAVLRGGWSRMTGERTTMPIRNIIAVDGMNTTKFRTCVPALTNNTLFARDCYICAYCANEFPTVSLTRDHVHPLSKQGENTWKNCVTACKICNNKKADRDIDDIAMNLHYVPYTPDLAEHMILSNKRILDDQMVYLKKMITNKNSRILQSLESRKRH